LTGIVASDCLPLGATAWQQERLALPARAPTAWRNILTGENVTVTQVGGAKRTLPLRELFASFPVALLHSEP
jgi:maltooligosyltrehalose synthase